MSRPAVDAAVERVRRADSTLGEHARTAAEWLTEGEGVEMLHQAAVQQFVWWDLPRKFESSRWEDVVRGAAALFDELGLTRYAEIARSVATHQMLGTWRFTPDAAAKRYQEAATASGVEPPDTDLLTWGSVMGVHEASARTAVEQALEAAIVAGELVPGRTGWKRTAGVVCDRMLTTSVDDDMMQCPLSLIVTERVGSWIMAARAEAHHEWRERIARSLLNPIPAPSGIATTVAPLSWLVAAASDGLALTQSGYIARPLVLEAIGRFGWWDWEKPPHSEADVPQLGALRDAATALRLIRRSGRRLTATSKGKSLLADPANLWAALATTLGGTDEFGKMIGELIGLRLLDGPAVDDALEQVLAPIIAAQGWRAGLQPVDARHVSHVIHRRLYWWRLLGLLDEERPRWENARRIGQARTALSPEGDATVLAYLRDSAIGPRTSPFG